MAAGRGADSQRGGQAGAVSPAPVRSLAPVRTHAVYPLTNPGFENGVTGWTEDIVGTGTSSAAADQVREGAGSLNEDGLGSNAGDYVSRYQDVNVSPQDGQSLTGWTWGTGALYSRARLLLRFLRSDDTEITTLGAYVEDTAFGDWDWTELKVLNARAPGETAKVRVILMLWRRTFPGGGECRWDSIRLSAPRAQPLAAVRTSSNPR